MSVEIEAAASGLSRGLVHELLTAGWAAPSVRTFGEPRGEGSSAPQALRLGIRGFGVSVRVSDRTGLGLIDRLRPLLAADLIAGPSGPFQIEIFATVRVDGRISLWSESDSRSVGDPSSAARALVTMIDFAIATEATEATFVHAGVVGWRGRAVLVPGRSRTGKSSLIAALVRRGAEYYSDEFAPIDSAGLVHAYARAPSPRRENGDFWPPEEPGGETALRIPPGPPLAVGAILSTWFRPGAQWHPRLVRGTRGLLPIIDNMLVFRDQPKSALTAAKSIAGAVTLSGPRPEADEVAPMILERIDQLLDTRSDAHRLRF